MEHIKEQISQWLDVTTDHLNEIAIEDVQFEPYTQENIQRAVMDLFSKSQQAGDTGALKTYETGEQAFRGFWVEDSKDLVVYTWLGSRLKVIVIPQSCWGVRDDITLN